jgi:X-X-X-Leu-X-X-Gly heptad repeat protein
LFLNPLGFTAIATPESVNGAADITNGATKVTNGSAEIINGATKVTNGDRSK